MTKLSSSGAVLWALRVRAAMLRKLFQIQSSGITCQQEISALINGHLIIPCWLMVVRSRAASPTRAQSRKTPMEISTLGYVPTR